MIRHARQMTEMPVRTAAIENFAFGGVNTSLIIRKAVVMEPVRQGPAGRASPKYPGMPNRSMSPSP
jgi:hypothetical protein